MPLAVTMIGLVATVERTPPGQVRHALMNDLRLTPRAASHDERGPSFFADSAATQAEGPGVGARIGASVAEGFPHAF